MESHRQCAPRIIPDAILSVLCILEEEAGRFQWKLSRNQDGISLVINAHYPDTPRTGRAPAPAWKKRRPKVDKQAGGQSHIVNGKTLEKETGIPESAEIPIPHKVVKRKSPSAQARSRARLRAFQLRKIKDTIQTNRTSAKTVTSNVTPILEPTVNSVTTEPNTSVLDAVKDPNQSVDCEQHLDSVPSQISTEIDSDDESDFSDSPECYNICANCTRESETEFKKCSKCKLCRYCSRECQLADWPRHKFVCSLLQADMSTNL